MGVGNQTQSLCKNRCFQLLSCLSTPLPFLFTILVTTVQQNEAKEKSFFEDILAPEFWQEVICKTGYDLGYRRYCQELWGEISIISTMPVNVNEGQIRVLLLWEIDLL